MTQINILWLFLIIPVSIIIGFCLGVYFIIRKIMKIAGLKNLQELKALIEKFKGLEKQMENYVELQKKMKEGNISSIMEEINKNPELKKQVAELQKRFGGNK